jgi:hypothetical protein
VGQTQVPLAGAQTSGELQATVLVTTRQPPCIPQVTALRPSAEQ